MCRRGPAGSVLRTGDLRSEPRWPEFNPQAYDATSIQSKMSYPLYREEQDGVVPGINFYSTQSDAFTLWAQTVGLLLATHGPPRRHAVRRGTVHRTGMTTSTGSLDPVGSWGRGVSGDTCPAGAWRDLR